MSIMIGGMPRKKIPEEKAPQEDAPKAKKKKQ